MKPLVAIIGRTNVGKSSLFNRMIRRQKALTHNHPGVTRDKIYGEVSSAPKPFILVDTGGLDPDCSNNLDRIVFDQAKEAVEEAQLILFIVDGREGLTALDEQLAEFVRRSNKPVCLAVNKVDGVELEDRLIPQFCVLGFDLIAVSAAHGYGIEDLIGKICEYLSKEVSKRDVEEIDKKGLTLALLGRPNAGKSSIVNTLAGEKRLLVTPEPGTTRDSVDVILEKDGYHYVFLDSAGVRRRSKIKDPLEQISVLRALKTSKRAHLTILVLEAVQGVTFQDKKLLSFLEYEKTPRIIAVNKIDLIPKRDRFKLKKYFEKQLHFCSYVPVIYTSTVTMAGLGGLLPLSEKLWKECSQRIGTGELNRVLQQVLKKHSPPINKCRRPKFYYLTQAETTPPTFVFFMNDHTLIQTSYKRYLENQLRKYFGFNMTPMQLIFRTSKG